MPLKIVLRPDSPHLQCRGTFEGVTVRESLKTSDRALAERKVHQIRERILREGSSYKEKETTFAAACSQYFDDHPIREGDEGAARMSRFLAPIIAEIGNTRLRDIAPVKIESLAKRMYPHYKQQSLNTAVIGPVSAVVNHAHRHGLCSPIKIKRFPEEDVRIARPIDRDWLDRFMAYAPSHLRAFALFQFTTGSRPQEACDLSPEQIDLDRGIATGDKRTKNRKRRTFILVPEMVEVLRALKPRQIDKGRHKGQFRVFGYSSRKSLLLPWRAVCKAAGLDYRDRYEAGRHSHFTQSITRHGADIPTAAKVGNITPEVALRRYAKAEKVEELAHEVFGTKSAQARQKRFKTVKGSKR
jgi:integrase